MSVPEAVGVAGVVAALSATSDLARGHANGEAMRACLLATELARRAGLDPIRQSDVYYTTLLRFAGCTATSHEIATTLGGNDVVVRARGDLVDPTRPQEALRFLLFVAGLGEGRGRLDVLRNLPRLAITKREGARADCEVGATLVRRLRLPAAVQQAVLDGFERFDGHGAPAAKSGSDIALASRFAAVAYAAVMFDVVGGRALGAEVVAHWSGRALDPEIAAIFRDAPDELLALSDPQELHAAVVDAEPSPRRRFADEREVDEVLLAYGDAADLKTPWFSGHSRGVARRVRAAAERFASADSTSLVRAAALHDLGRVAVPTGVWEQ
ncbi:MAG TPA: metal-dependent phosphohydrolase, partial [Candidatus Dormibacteraeota bacterium]